MRSFLIAFIGALSLLGCGASSVDRAEPSVPEVITTPDGDSWRQYSLSNGTLVLAETRLRAVITVTKVNFADNGLQPRHDLEMLAAEAASDGLYCPLTYHYSSVASMIPPPEWVGPGRAAAFHLFDAETSGGVILRVSDGTVVVLCGRWRDEYDGAMRNLLKDMADKIHGSP